ncbi:MAG TPA: gamma-glutamyltransferase [Usitatibacter sp.]|nr:gamma-glutamyltransferase [Usitatibacter sp.]
MDMALPLSTADHRVQDATASPPGQSVPAAVAAGFPAATEAAVEVLREGGNAMDAAVAAAWALGVCEPSASGLGGHTVMLVRLASGRTVAIDGASRAPATASIATITASDQEGGYRSCTVPSTPATLDWAQRRYGVLSRERVMAPAIRIAHEGYEVTPLQHRQTRSVVEALRATPGGQLFLNGGQAPRPGERRVQPQLAQTLERLASLGATDFYEGAIARQIAQDMRRNGGLLDEGDLAHCSPPEEMEPLSTVHGDHLLLSAPPPSSGLDLLLAFNVMNELRSGGLEAGSDSWREAVALTTSAVFRERERRALGATDMDQHVRQQVLGAPYAHDMARNLHNPAALGAEHPEEPGDTTHVSVCDAAGNVVLLTQSIHSVFGARVAHPELGFIYNNYLALCQRARHPHLLRPHCRPRSNIAPLLVLRADAPDARPVMALGAAGSRRIVSSTLQVVGATLALGRDIGEAVAAPRVHGLMGREVWIERSAASDALLARLHARGREPMVKPDFDYSMGAVHALVFNENGRVSAAADPRRDGAVRITA